MDVLLIEPPYYKLMGEVRFWIPIGLMNLSHYLNEAGITARIYNGDATSDFEIEKGLSYSDKFYRSDVVNDSSTPLWKRTLKEIEALLTEGRPKAVGVSVKSDTVVSALTIISSIRKYDPTIKILVGGTHFTSLLDDIFYRSADAIIVGEGEEVIVRAVKEIMQLSSNSTNCKIFKSNSRFDVNQYVDVDFDYLVDSQMNGINKLTKLMVASSRGCPFQCAFCFKSIGSDCSVRYVSGRSIAEYMIKFYNTHGISKYYFVDDTFGISNQQLSEFAEAIRGYESIISWSCMSHVNVLKESKIKVLKELGCSAIHLGVESGSQRILDKMNKGTQITEVVHCASLIHKYGIELRTFILFGIPGETVGDLELTKELLKQIRPDEIAAQVYVPYNNTVMFNNLIKNRQIECIDWSRFTKSHIEYGIVKDHICKSPVIKNFFDFVDEWNILASKG